MNKIKLLVCCLQLKYSKLIDKKYEYETIITDQFVTITLLLPLQKVFIVHIYFFSLFVCRFNFLFFFVLFFCFAIIISDLCLNTLAESCGT